MADVPVPFSELLADCAERCVAPVWAQRTFETPPEEVDHNGTITFIDTGTLRLAVTAHHVYAKFLEFRAENPAAGLVVNLGSISPFLEDVTLVDADPRLDLAVLVLPDLSSWKPHDKRYFPIVRFPIPVPARGSAVTIVGFPGIQRRAANGRGTFSATSVGMVVSNDPGANVMLVDSDGSLRTRLHDVERLGGINPGGLSGAAGFFFHEGRFHLAGFVYEGDERMLFLAPGVCLRQDGTLGAP